MTVLPLHDGPTPPPPYRGRLLTVEDVCQLLEGVYSRKWIYANLEAGRRTFSRRCVRWREYDVLEWINL